MSMDAAFYITTLEDTAPQGNKPEVASYAIMDLAVAHDFLERLYGAMANQPIEWWSLFEGTEWQSDWSSGPILVDLRSCGTFMQQLAIDMEARSLGVMIETPLDAQKLRDRCQKWLFGAGGAQLLRYYEPRMLGPLLCVMGDVQLRQFMPPGEQWFWHDGLVWRTLTGKDSATTIEESLTSVSEEQLRQVSRYRMAAQAESFASYYGSSLTACKDPTVWVLNCLLEAHESGVTTVSDQERWLRLAIRHGDAFPADAQYQEVLKQEQWSASERLTAMESIRKPDYVPTA
ncbi:DUF4123 domain-containing protein [Marinobacter sp. GN3S48]|uniref:DUF4123 domain-containing protein n=1 Tax=Marinobacter sp. GN3S48 TaxID=3382302 RepID=UPI00387B1D0C